MTVFNKGSIELFREKAALNTSLLINLGTNHTDDFYKAKLLADVELNETEQSLEVFLENLHSIPLEYRMKKVVCFDTETTDTFNAHAVSIALILYNIQTERIEKEFYSLINPLMDITYEAQQVHGITPEDVKNEKTFDELESEIASFFIEADMVVGHNVDFDLKVIEREYDRLNKLNPTYKLPYFDTMIMSKNIVQATDVRGKIKMPQLGEAVTFFGIEEPEGMYHNALVDTEQCLKVFQELLKQ